MANLGAIGVLGCETEPMTVAGRIPTLIGAVLGCETEPMTVAQPALRLSSFTIGLVKRFAIGGEDFGQGNPAPPCIRLDAKGIWRFRWALPVGQHTISVNVMQAVNLNPRPSLAIRANPAIGILADIESFAPPSATWTMIGPVNVTTTTATGATWVELRCNLDSNVGAFPCYFDHVVKT
jgi:hypothetical protein